MTDTISQGLLGQDEVDSLLNMLASDIEDFPNPTLGTSENAGEMVRRYDFHQPDRFSKEHIRTLRMLHENMARRLALQLSTKLRTSIDVKLAVIEPGPYASFVQQIAESPGALHIVSLKPLPGRMLIQYDSRLSDMLVDRLLGGAGMPSADTERELTDLEMDLLTSVTNDVMGTIRDSWEGTIELQCKLEEMMTNPYFVQVALPTDTCAWISFEMTVNGRGAALNYCIPASVLKPIMPKLSPQAWIAGSEQPNDTEDWATVRKFMRRHLENTRVELTAVLRGGEILLSELMTLEEGDVIPLQRDISEKVVLTMQGREKLSGHLGMQGRRVSVEVTDVLDGRDDSL